MYGKVQLPMRPVSLTVVFPWQYCPVLRESTATSVKVPKEGSISSENIRSWVSPGLVQAQTAN